MLQVPIGFVADHLEIMYDIDYEAKNKAAELGMTLHRTAMPNATPAFIDNLAAIVTAHEQAERPLAATTPGRGGSRPAGRLADRSSASHRAGTPHSPPGSAKGLPPRLESYRRPLHRAGIVRGR